MNELKQRLIRYGLTDKQATNFVRKLSMPNWHGCILWNAATNFSGYGTFGFGGKTWAAQRLAYAALHPEEDITDAFITQPCGNHRCVEHLQRQEKRPTSVDPREFQSKLHPDTVKRLQAMDYATTNKVAEARRLGVSPDTVRKAMKGFTWKNTSPPSTSSAGSSKSTTKVSASMTTTSRSGASSGVHPWRERTSSTFGST